MTLFEGDVAATKVVSVMDVAHALATELSFSTGLLPPGTIWWQNTADGPVFALYEQPKVWRVALQEKAMGEPRRFKIPLPGLIFLCTPGQPPWVFAVKKKPSRLTDIVYKAPLANIFASGRSCPGNHKYPTDVGKMVDSFFRSFFSPTADLRDRSQRFPEDVTHLWEFLDGKKRYPLADLVKHGTVRDLMTMDTKR